MNWYYAQGGNQLGPVTQEEFDRLVAAGTITGTTLVWHDGLNNWQPWETLQPPVASASAAEVLPAPPVAGSGPAAPGRVRCRECGGDFAEEDTIRFGDARVCAACKPVFLQRLAEGAALSALGAGQAGPDEVLRRDYRIDLGRCVERGWAMFKASPGLLIGGVLVAYGLMFAGQMAVGLLGLLIPFIGTLIAPFVQAPLMGGLCLLYLSCVRNQPADVSFVFRGFSPPPRWLQLSLAMLVQTVLMGVAMLPLVALIGGGVILGVRPAGGGPPTATMTAGMVTLFVIGGVLFAAAMIYVTTSWMFAIPLIMDKGLKFWPAMELSRKVVAKHFWQCVLLLLVSGLIAGVGLLACGVGMIVSAPVAFAMWCWAYEDLFGDMVSQ